MKKRILAVCFAAAVLAVSLASCTSPAKVKVNGVKIDNEIYNYYKSVGEKSAEGDSLDNYIKGCISRYTAINSEFANRNLSLTTQQKAELSQTVNDIWHLYGRYYGTVGVSKQTIYKIEESKQFEQALLTAYYGKNGTAPVPEDEIKAHFSENYAAVRFISGYLFSFDENGATVPMTEEQKKNTVQTFESAAAMINEGTVIEEASGSFGENTEVYSSVVSSFSDGTFPTGFFEAVKTVENGKAAAVILGDYIFLVQRIDAFSEEYNYYSEYRTECLNQMKGAEFRAIVDEWTKNYIAE